MTDDLTVIYPRLRGPGWDPVTVMTRAMAKYLGARLIEFPAHDAVNRLRSVLSILPRRRASVGNCLVVASRPAYLLSALQLAHWFPGFRSVNAWVIDSFWTEHIPPAIRRNGHIDHIFVANGEVVDIWRKMSGVSTSCLPIASDVLERGSSQGDRPIDLLRLGRQPSEWEDDTSNAVAAAEQNIVYGGRPPYHADADRNNALLCETLARSKFTLAFTNAASPAGYTHPTREYLTSRWIDALASGSTVAGISPKCQEIGKLLWPGALLELGTTRRDVGLGMISEARNSWTPAQALRNHVGALRNLYVRWRCRSIADHLNIKPGILETQIKRLEHRIAEIGTELP